MLIKPDLKDEEIIACLQDTYKLNVATISFLPIGADFNTAVYRVTATDEADYFLKLRSGKFLEASVSVPKYLADLGVKQVIPPIPTKTGKLCSGLRSFKTILYPYVEGRNGVDAKPSDDHWVQFGATVKKLHSLGIPSSITQDVSREMFSSKWRETVKAFLIRIENEVFEEPVAVKMALFLKSKSSEILKLVEHAETLAITTQKQPLDYVLCHADMHGWNLIIDKEGSLYIVDFDTLIFAPKERDLMFIGAGIWDSGRTASAEEPLFYQGYGKAEINHDLLAYYRFERIIQDIGDYCEYIFLSDEGSLDRMQCFEHLQPVFLPNGAIERACQFDKTREIL
ncbi:Aminoglycoside phosphotransferase family protein [Candidatus Trichorickettsia mobilis]|uniref:Aminoglycoside phosphotransferase family protein n=1 Tax=Candidatus Trichorickettsia mobilis TaxID=1346319 RepID=A0ABZ0UVP6_9RICK|nr:aminoglycoside phosphotransferase family protein [Candidatus Trichorickettsia mobilis]WPY00697.1 Aminoglycoside phosphotransferase family protein [Candidatus Trichorickettsia mobilis]